MQAKSQDSQFQNIEHELRAVSEQLAELTCLVHDLAKAQRPKLDPLICNWREAAHLVGIDGPNAPARARERIRYQNDKPDGYTIRTTHGGCFRKDVVHFVELEAKRRQGRGERIRRAIRT